MEPNYDDDWIKKPMEWAIVAELKQQSHKTSKKYFYITITLIGQTFNLGKSSSDNDLKSQCLAF